MSTYNQEVLNQIKELKKKIEVCTDECEVVHLQTELLEKLKATLNDSKFKEELLKGYKNGPS